MKTVSPPGMTSRRDFVGQISRAAALVPLSGIAERVSAAPAVATALVAAHDRPPTTIHVFSKPL